MVYFHPSSADEAASADDGRRGGGADVEAWQILSPVRAGETGVDGLNRCLQRSFRGRVRDWADPEKPWQRKTCKPLGPQGILYGDKVINLVNGRRRDVYPANDTAYLANGEIGLVVGQFKGSTRFGQIGT